MIVDIDTKPKASAFTLFAGTMSMGKLWPVDGCITDPLEYAIKRLHKAFGLLEANDFIARKLFMSSPTYDYLQDMDKKLKENERWLGECIVDKETRAYLWTAKIELIPMEWGHFMAVGSN